MTPAAPSCAVVVALAQSRVPVVAPASGFLEAVDFFAEAEVEPAAGDFLGEGRRLGAAEEEGLSI